MAEHRQGAGEASGRLRQLFADAWEFRLRENPVAATETGDRRYNDRLPQVSVADEQRRAGYVGELLERLAAIPRDELSTADQLNARIFEQQLRDQLADYEFRTYLLPVHKIHGPHITLPQLHEYTPFESALDYEQYIARLRASGDYLRQTIELLRQGLRAGITVPRVALEGVEDSLATHLVDDLSQSAFLQPFQQLPPALGAADGARLRAAAEAALREQALPGLRALRDFLRDDYLPGARDEVGASALPNGRAYYEHCVRHHTTTDLTPEQIHQIGHDEVRRIRTEMQAIIDQVGFQGDFHAFVEFLRTDPRFYVATPEALLEKVALIMKRMDGELPRLFKTLPRIPYGIREIPAHSAPGNTTAYYFPPAGDGSRAGFYYVNTYDLKSRPLYEVEALSLHEAVPGHHLHLALQAELGELPEFRRFGWITAFGEGWALYAERLGLEVGFYQDPYSNFGRLTYEMWRACRLVVDTGIHALGWSRQQAIDFMAENTALTLLNITNEVDRYIGWPGQALGYKIGELTISRLRREAERRLGERFDLRAFHDRVLEHGVIPLNVLEDNVEAWVREVSGS